MQWRWKVLWSIYSNEIACIVLISRILEIEKDHTHHYKYTWSTWSGWLYYEQLSKYTNVHAGLRKSNSQIQWAPKI